MEITETHLFEALYLLDFLPHEVSPGVSTIVFRIKHAFLPCCFVDLFRCLLLLIHDCVVLGVPLVLFQLRFALLVVARRTILRSHIFLAAFEVTIRRPVEVLVQNPDFRLRLCTHRLAHFLLLHHQHLHFSEVIEVLDCFRAQFHVVGVVEEIVDTVDPVVVFVVVVVYK